MTSEWVWIAVVAIFWGAYPLVTRACGYEGPWATLLVGVIAVAPVIAYVSWQGGAYARPSPGQLGALALAGLMQGVGLIAFLRVASGSLEASVAIPISDVAMLVVTAVGALVFFQEAVTLQKLFGLGLLVTGIALLRPA
jgi:drug/metabolite transporter (DMT)-like permease